jgi:hypothetical protein
VLEVKHAAGSELVEPAPTGIRSTGAPRLRNVLSAIRRSVRGHGGSP